MTTTRDLDDPVSGSPDTGEKASAPPPERGHDGGVPAGATGGVGGMTARSRRLTLVAMCLGAMMTFLEITASISSLAAIQSDLGLSPTALVWIPSAYTLAVASLVLSSGTLGNLFGRKRLFALGVVVLAAGSLLVVLSSSTGVLLLGQAVAGVGGALVLPNSLAILSATFTHAHQRTEAISIWAASSGVGLALGPLIAGAVLDHYSWHVVFLANLVLAAAALAVTLPFVGESRQPGARLDPGGLVLGTLTIAALVFALIQGGHEGFTSGRIVTAWLVSAAAAALFVGLELRVGAPMLDVRLFRSASFSAVMLVAAVAIFGFTGVSLLLVLFYQRVQGLSALDTGWRLLVEMGAYVVAAAVTGRLIRRTGFKAPLTVGLVVSGLASIGLVWQDAGTGFGQVWPLLALFGAGCGLVVAPSTAAALVSVAPAQAGMASGAVNTARQVGAVMGTSILGTLATSRLVANLPGELAGNQVPVSARAGIEAAVASGSTSASVLSAGARSAIGSAFTSGVHAGMVLNGVVFLVAALVAVAAVHNRPQHRASTAAAPTSASTTR